MSRQSAHEGGKVVSPTYRPPLPPGSIPDPYFCYRLSRPQGHSAVGRPDSSTNVINSWFRDSVRPVASMAWCLINLLKPSGNFTYDQV
jgi:hypothetical protein